MAAPQQEVKPEAGAADIPVRYLIVGQAVPLDSPFWEAHAQDVRPVSAG